VRAMIVALLSAAGGALIAESVLSVASPPPGVPRPPPFDVRPSTGAPRAVEATSGECARLHAERAALEREITLTRKTASLASKELAILVGEPLPWPPDHPEQWGAEAVRQRIEERSDELPGELLAIDCDEWPCVMFLRRRHASESTIQSVNAFEWFTPLGKPEVEIADDGALRMLDFTWSTSHILPTGDGQEEILAVSVWRERAEVSSFRLYRRLEYRVEWRLDELVFDGPEDRTNR